ncbi:MAG: hypothetical protein OEU36_14130 [Gammaproteobacteria bacterium]|nr:hypothetical protein [Gammaproteobacteria bacterium]
MLLLLTSGPGSAEEAQRYLAPPGDDGVTVLLSAPHTGSPLCEAAPGTRVRFIQPVRHGPHKYGLVQVLEGICAGVEGFAPWNHIANDPSNP